MDTNFVQGQDDSVPPKGSKPRDYVVDGAFGRVGAVWQRLVDPTTEEVAAVAGAFEQHRWAIAVRTCLVGKLTEQVLARLMFENGNDRAVLVSLRRRLDGYSWATVEDLAVFRMLLPIPDRVQDLPDGSDAPLPASCAHLLANWNPGALILPSSFGATGGDAPGWRRVLSVSVAFAAREEGAGREHLLDSSVLRRVVMEELERAGVPPQGQALLGVNGAHADFVLDEPWRQVVRISVRHSLLISDFSALDEACCSLLVGLYGLRPLPRQRPMVLLLANDRTWTRLLRQVPRLQLNETTVDASQLLPEDIAPLMEGQTIAGVPEALASVLEYRVVARTVAFGNFRGAVIELVKHRI